MALHQGNYLALMIFHETPKIMLKVFGSIRNHVKVLSSFN